MRAAGTPTDGRIDEWEPIPGQEDRSGRQGKVVQVQHRQSRRLGALKTLHAEHIHSRERRYRMQQEVALLKLLNGSGVPRVFSSNVDDWQTDGTPLYVVIEWIDGPSLDRFCNGCPHPIDGALSVVSGLTNTVSRCHAVGVLHRDIKPDNVILRAGSVAEPVLVDFGMGWAAPSENDTRELRTADGQELGNRFLRLPEYAPGHHVHDTRSDVTMIVGILFYLLAGAAPRVLLDPSGRMPHEAMLDRFPRETTADPRWERIRRIFKVGFQYRIDMRFLDAAQLASALGNLSDASIEDSFSSLNAQLRRIQELTDSPDGLLLVNCQQESLQALRDFFTGFIERAREIEFVAKRINPTVAEWGRAVTTTVVVHKPNVTEPKVGFVYKISFENGKYQASYSFVGEAIWTRAYEGSLADAESLRDAVVGSRDAVLTAALQRYTTGLEQHVSRMKG
jgi:serine/threonine protein kinase